MKYLILCLALLGACTVRIAPDQPAGRTVRYEFSYMYRGSPVRYYAYNFYECQSNQRRVEAYGWRILRPCHRI